MGLGHREGSYPLALVIRCLRSSPSREGDGHPTSIAQLENREVAWDERFYSPKIGGRYTSGEMPEGVRYRCVGEDVRR